MSALEDLIALEKRIDAQIPQLGVLKLPLNAVAAALFLLVDNQFHGPRAPGSSNLAPGTVGGYALASRLSYLLPHLLACPSTPVGQSIAEALSLLDRPDFAELRFFVQYGHFCEIMPEVHRGLYGVTGSGDEFALTHTSGCLAKAEARDIVLTELAMPYYLEPPSHQAFFDALAETPLTFNPRAIVAIKQYYEFHSQHISESPILSDAAFLKATGATYAEFTRFRAAWVAVAELALGMAAALSRRLGRTLAQDDELLHSERMEWMSVFLKSSFLSGVVCAVGDLSSNAFDALMRLFSIDVASGHAKQAGEGYFPPILAYNGAYQFNPDILRVMLSARNVPYALNRVDRKRFNNLVSSDLEPQLLRAAVPILEELPAVEVVTNYAWSAGEIDLLVYRPSENVVLHIQAKAAVPPQGARMVERVEQRSLEGLRQLSSFRSMPPDQIDSIVSAAVQRRVSGTRVIDVLLCRSSVGSERVWSQLGNVAVVNLPLLRLVVSRMVANSDALCLFSQRATEALDEIYNAVFRGWNPRVIEVGDARITMPILSLDNEELNRRRAIVR